jgi:hypothetical protein
MELDSDCYIQNNKNKLGFSNIKLESTGTSAWVLAKLIIKLVLHYLIELLYLYKSSVVDHSISVVNWRTGGRKKYGCQK